MAIDRPNVFSNDSAMKFYTWNGGISSSIEFTKLRYIKIVLYAGSAIVTSSSSNSGLNQVILNSSGSAQDSVFEVYSPNGGTINDITFTTTGGTAAQANIYYIQG